MLNIYLCRHGQDEDNIDGILNGHRDTLLTKMGILQAENAAKEISKLGIHFDIVYTSPLKRAYKTAEIITNKLNSPAPKIYPSLIERNFGSMTGQKISDIEKICSPKIFKTDTITYFLETDGAETFPELVMRGQSILDDMQNRHSSGNILLVTHGDIGKMIYAAYYNIDWQEVLRSFHFGNSEVLLLSNNIKGNTHIIKTKQFNL